MTRQQEVNLQQLPKPDAYGNYWLKARACAPAILSSGKSCQPGKWFVTVEGEPHLLCNHAVVGGGLLYFDGPLEALAALRKHIESRE